MENSRLIMLEGLPGTGKSTNSYFLWTQLERQGQAVRWIHEVARPHPCFLFGEACLTLEEYDFFLKAHPRARPVLERLARFRKCTVGIDLLEVEWKHLDHMGRDAFEALKEYDGWNLPLERYAHTALEKWEAFTAKALEGRHAVYLLDGAIFQYQIFVHLLKNASYQELELELFVRKLMEIIRPLHPALLYFYRENACDTVAFLEKRRGKGFLERIWERDKAEPYYRDKPPGAEGHRRFLLDYAEMAERLFDAVDCRKKAVEISKQDWTAYEDELLAFFGAERRACPQALAPDGIFTNQALGMEIGVSGLRMKDPNGTERALHPKSGCEFYVECLPVVLRFHGPDQLEIAGEQICERWTTAGTRFHRAGAR